MMYNYISLKEASKISGYHSDYLGFLIRKGKLEGKKIGRNWFIDEKSLKSLGKDFSSKEFFLIKDLIFSKLNPKIIFSFVMGAILLVALVFLIYPSTSYFRVSGDFQEQIKSQKTDQLKIENVKIIKIIDTYFSTGSEVISTQLK